MADSNTIIPFDEIIPGATVRFTLIDGVQYLSVRDIIMVMCDKNEKRSSETWLGINSARKTELSEFLGSFKSSSARSGITRACVKMNTDF